PAMRGRVMALYGVLFLGTTPIGSPAVGLIAQWLGPRWAMAIAAAVTLVAALVILRAVLRDADATPAVPAAAELPLPGSPSPDVGSVHERPAYTGRAVRATHEDVLADRRDHRRPGRPALNGALRRRARAGRHGAVHRGP